MLSYRISTPCESGYRRDAVPIALRHTRLTHRSDDPARSRPAVQDRLGSQISPANRPVGAPRRWLKSSGDRCRCTAGRRRPRRPRPRAAAGRARPADRARVSRGRWCTPNPARAASTSSRIARRHLVATPTDRRTQQNLDLSARRAQLDHRLEAPARRSRRQRRAVRRARPPITPATGSASRIGTQSATSTARAETRLRP